MLSNRFRPAATLRNYAAAALLNLALVSTVLAPSDRPRPAHTRLVTDARLFRDAELIRLDDGEVGVLSAPYHLPGAGTAIGGN